jgi:hypothetical protein
VEAHHPETGMYRLIPSHRGPVFLTAAVKKWRVNALPKALQPLGLGVAQSTGVQGALHERLGRSLGHLVLLSLSRFSLQRPRSNEI